MKILLIVSAAVVIGVLVFGGQLMGIRKDLARQREAITASWGHVDVAIERRAELVPHLVDTVKGIAREDKEVFAHLTSARGALRDARSPQERIEANQRLDTAVGRLLLVTENYPQLKSSENFLRLLDDLAGTENRIAVERRKYNEAVQRYNTSLELFPNNAAATLFGFARNDAYYRASPEAQRAPQLKF
ncbi:MAG TPA: LemA family protein [Solibacterales bacterium]|nr:LemA family protein [Bryobacterales bacterium]